MGQEQKYPPLSEDPDIKGKSEEEILEEARRKHQENVEKEGSDIDLPFDSEIKPSRN